MGEQTENAFKKYLLQKNSVNFNFRGADYHTAFAGTDIDNDTMDVMYSNDRRLQEKVLHKEIRDAHISGAMPAVNGKSQRKRYALLRTGWPSRISFALFAPETEVAQKICPIHWLYSV